MRASSPLTHSNSKVQEKELKEEKSKWWAGLPAALQAVKSMVHVNTLSHFMSNSVTEAWSLDSSLVHFTGTHRYMDRLIGCSKHLFHLDYSYSSFFSSFCLFFLNSSPDWLWLLTLLRQYKYTVFSLFLCFLRRTDFFFFSINFATF